MSGLTYLCLFCNHTMTTDHMPPTDQGEEWYKMPGENLLHCCEKCGCFAIPAFVQGIKEAGPRPWRFFYSHCPNAFVCYTERIYGPQCETGLVTQECFAAVHARIDHILDRLDALFGKLGPAPQPPAEPRGTDMQNQKQKLAHLFLHDKKLK